MMKSTIVYLSAGALSVVGVAAVLLFTPAGDGPLAGLLPVGAVEPFDFANAELPDKPNRFLMCPPGYCRATPHAESPVFPIPVETLSQGWRALAADQPRLALLAESENGQQLDYVQRSARFRFPDIISVRFIARSPGVSTLAIYSRSLYGKSDFGVNRKRIESWLELLSDRL